MNKLSKQINPVPVAIAAVVAAVALGYFFFIRPGQVESQIQKNWVTPEAAAARHDERPRNEKQEDLIAQLRAKEGADPSVRHVRHKDRD